MFGKELFDFEWSVDKAGYELVPEVGAELPTRRKLFEHKPAVVRALGGEISVYKPSDMGLHRVFANLERDENALLEFVNSYGFLRRVKGNEDDLEFMLEALDDVKLIVSEIEDRRFNNADRGSICGRLFNQTMCPPMTVRIDNSNPKRLILNVVPTSLLSWIWLLVAQEIVEGRSWSKCASCSEYFPVGKGQHTSRRKYCSDKCKMAWHRKLKAKEGGR